MKANEIVKALTGSDKAMKTKKHVIKHHSELHEKLNELHGQVVDSIVSFFRNTERGDRFNFKGTFQSNENDSIEILGIAKGDGEIYLYGEDQYGEGRSGAIENCSIENLLGALDRLEGRSYTQDRD